MCNRRICVFVNYLITNGKNWHILQLSSFSLFSAKRLLGAFLRFLRGGSSTSTLQSATTKEYYEYHSMLFELFLQFAIRLRRVLCVS